MATPAQAATRHPRRRWLLVSASVVVLGLLGYFVVAPLVQGAVLRATLPAELAEARSRAQAGADAEHATWQELTAGTLNLDAPVYSAVYDVCWVDHNDGGWFAVNYNQKCMLRYLDYYRLDAKNSAVEKAVRSTPASGAHTAAVWVSDYLDALGRSGQRLPDYLPFQIRAPLSDVTDAHTAADASVIADDPVVTYAMPDAYAGRVLLSETGSTALSGGHRYLIVGESHPYFEKDIGCAIGRPILCQSPLG